MVVGYTIRATARATLPVTSDATTTMLSTGTDEETGTVMVNDAAVSYWFTVRAPWYVTLT